MPISSCYYAVFNDWHHIKSWVCCFHLSSFVSLWSHFISVQLCYLCCFCIKRLPAALTGKSLSVLEGFYCETSAGSVELVLTAAQHGCSRNECTSSVSCGVIRAQVIHNYDVILNHSQERLAPFFTENHFNIQNCSGAFDYITWRASSIADGCCQKWFTCNHTSSVMSQYTVTSLQPGEKFMCWGRCCDLMKAVK